MMHPLTSAIRDPFGVTEVLRSTYPDGLLQMAEWLNALGGFPLVLVLPLVFYLYFDQRRQMALVLAYLLASQSIVFVLKSFFGLPQSPEIYHIIDIIPEGDTNGFPSRAAAAATAVYIGTVYEVDTDKRRLWGAFAGFLVLAISVSRVVLGYHYLGDMIAGGVLGMLTVVVISHVSDGNPVYGFALALPFTVLAVPVSGNTQAIMAMGGALGGVMASLWVRNSDSDILKKIAQVAIGLLLIAFALLIQQSAGSIFVILVVLYAVLFGAILSIPNIVNRIQTYISPHLPEQ